MVILGGFKEERRRVVMTLVQCLDPNPHFIINMPCDCSLTFRAGLKVGDAVSLVYMCISFLRNIITIKTMWVVRKRVSRRAT